MTAHVWITCDHPGGRTDKDPMWIDRWERGPAADSWSSAWLDAGLGTARENHQTRLNAMAERGVSSDPLIDDQGRLRLRGGITRTRRGWQIECPGCTLAPRIRHVRLLAVLDECAAGGEDTITLSVLDTRAQAAGHVTGD